MNFQHVKNVIGSKISFSFNESMGIYHWERTLALRRDRALDLARGLDFRCQSKTQVWGKLTLIGIIIHET